MGIIHSKTEYNKFYVPINVSAEARICLECSNKKCKGTCKRLVEEKRKLKQKLKNDREKE